MFWKQNKPEHELAYIWDLMKPMLFGSVGAAIKVKEVSTGVLGKGLAIVLIGIIFRLTATFFCAIQRKYSLKEKIFMSIAWIPKATVQAAIGGVVLDEARKRGKIGEEYVKYGTDMLTIAVIAIVLTAPLGAILTNSLGPVLLESNKVASALDLTK